MASPTTEVAPSAEGEPPESRPARPRPRDLLVRGFRELGLSLITIGVVILLFVGYQLWGTGFAERNSQASLKRGFQAAVSANVAGSGDNPTVGTVTTRPTTRTVTTRPANRTVTTHPTADTTTTDNPTVGSSASASPSAALHGAVDHLIIPKIKLDKYVVQGVDEGDLQQGPGHYPQTVLPGQDGNAAIAGHRTTYGAPFFDLNELTVGDVIYLTDTSGQVFTYTVSEPAQVVSPSDSSVLDPTSFPELTLTTCNPRFSSTSRLVIVARLTGQPARPAANPTTGAIGVTPTTAGQIAAVDNLGSGNQAGWPPAVGFGALVLALWISARILIHRTRRWARAGACVGGIAICLVPLWFCFENVVRLLPQNI